MKIMFKKSEIQSMIQEELERLEEGGEIDFDSLLAEGEEYDAEEKTVAEVLSEIKVVFTELASKIRTLEKELMD